MVDIGTNGINIPTSTSKETHNAAVVALLWNVEWSSFSLAKWPIASNVGNKPK
jgi:hypothetical protein